MLWIVSLGLNVLVAPIAINRAGSSPAATSSLVRQSSSSANSCKYKHSGFVHVTPFRNALQYLVVPKHAFTCRPFHVSPSICLMHLSASSGRLNVTYADPVGPLLCLDDE